MLDLKYLRKLVENDFKSHTKLLNIYIFFKAIKVSIFHPINLLKVFFILKNMLLVQNQIG